MSTEPKPATVTIATTVNVPEQRVSDLLCGAFEGGSTYWATSCEIVSDADTDDLYPSDAVMLGHDVEIEYSADDSDEDTSKVMLTRDKAIAGLQIMAQKYPSHFGDFMSENDDASTADVFVQCAVFGEIIYG